MIQITTILNQSKEVIKLLVEIINQKISKIFINKIVILLMVFTLKEIIIMELNKT